MDFYANKRLNDIFELANKKEKMNKFICDRISFILNNMENFKKVRLRLSVDCAEKAGEYFRYGLKWDEWCNNIRSFFNTDITGNILNNWTEYQNQCVV